MSKKKMCLMYALILIVMISVVCILIINPFESMQKETIKSSSPQENTEILNSNKEEIIEDIPVMEEEIVQEEQQVEEEKEVKKEEKKETNKTSQSTSKKENSSNIVKENEQQTIIKENNDKPLEQETIEQNNSTTEIVDEVVEEKKDAEYETLLSQVQYATYEECMEIGFDEAIKDPVGILGFSCPYIAYKGKVIGYRLKLDYTNPMEN